MVFFKKNRVSVALGLIFIIAASGCGSDKKDKPISSTDIRWTSYGVPHIKADNYTDLAEGLGYVMAKDRYCNIVETVITAKGERAMHLGSGSGNENINSDFGYKHLGAYQQAMNNFQNLDSRTQELMRGFASGFNHAIANNQQFDHNCDIKVASIDHLDVFTMNLSMNYWPFIGEYIQSIGQAEPSTSQPSGELFNRKKSLAELAKGSNGWAIGKEMTKSGKGMMLSNTHLPHKDHFLWYEAHLTIPNKLNVYGGFLPGFLTPALGFNDTFSWTHTWSASTTGSFYVLTPSTEASNSSSSNSSSNKMSYVYGDEVKELSSNNYQIQVKKSDGSLSLLERTLYNSDYGPIVTFDYDGFMVAIKDAPSKTSNKADFWLKLALSKDVPAAVSLINQGYRTGSQNIMMADANGETFYADLAEVPKLSDEAWQTIIQRPDLLEHGGEMLDGANPIFEWESVSPLNEIPKRYSSSYVQNANDAPWLVNMEAPLVDYSPFYGDSEYQQSTRTQLSLVMLEQLKQREKKADLDDLRFAMADKRLYLAELVTDDLIERCQAYPEYILNGETIDLQSACQILENWDRRANLDSVGSHIFREYAIQIDVYRESQGCEFTCWGEAFDITKPLTTPAKLPALIDNHDDIHMLALASAVMAISDSGLSEDTKVSQYQQLVKGDKSHPIAGGMGGLTGSFSTLNVDTRDENEYYSYTGLSKNGYDINVGDGFIFLLEFTAQGVNANSVLLYSQSNNPASAHYFDQAPLIDGGYKTIQFNEKSIKDDTNLITETLTIK